MKELVVSKTKELVVSRTISYCWWRGDKNNIKPAHVEALKERAMERIHEMSAQGFQCGELFDNIHMTDDDPEDGVEYKGCWDVQED